LAAAADLANAAIGALMVEKKPRLGGYAARYACKATRTCAKCGAYKYDRCLHGGCSLPQLPWAVEQHKKLDALMPRNI
jgi:hypothetical protein